MWNAQRPVPVAPPTFVTSSHAWPLVSKFRSVAPELENPIAVLPTKGTTSADTVAAEPAGAANGSSARDACPGRRARRRRS